MIFTARGLVLTVLLSSGWGSDPLSFSAPAAIGRQAKSATGVVELKTRTPRTEDIKPGDTRYFSVRLAKGDFLAVAARRKSVDVSFRVLGPDGKPVTDDISTDGMGGVGRARLVGTTEGEYRLAVTTAEKDAAPGNFEVTVEELRGATEADRTLVEADEPARAAKRLGDAKKFDQAIPLAEKSLELTERARGANDPAVADSLTALAGLYSGKLEYDRAAALAARVLVIREKQSPPNDRDIAVAYNNLGLINRFKADYPKATAFYAQAISRFEKLPDQLDLAECLNNLAVVYRVNGDYTRAEPLSQRALAAREKALGLNHLDVAQSLNNLGLLYNFTGEYDKAEPLLSRALSIFEKKLGPDHLDVAACLNNLGLLYKTAGNYAKAEPAYLRALGIKEKKQGAEHPDVALTLNNLGQMYVAKGDFAKAEPLIQRALTIREKQLGAGHPEVGTANNNLGLLYLYEGDFQKAEAPLRRGVAIYEAGLPPDHPLMGTGLTNLGRMYLAGGDYEKAEPLFVRAATIREKVLGPTHLDTAGSLDALSILYRAKGNIDKAVATMDRANDAMEQNFLRNLVGGSEQQKLAYLRRTATFVDRTISLHVQAAPNDPAAARAALSVILRRKGRALDVMARNVEALRARATPEDRALLDKLAVSQTQLANLLVRSPNRKDLETYRRKVQDLEAAVDALQADIGKRSAPFLANIQPVTVEAVQKAVPVGSVLVEFIVYKPYDPKSNAFGPPRYVAYVLPPTGPVAWVELGETATIDAAIQRLRRTYTLADAKAKRDNKPLAREVDALVMAPVRKLVGDINRIVISPDGALNLLPFAALVDESNRYLVERYTLTYVTSGRDLLRLQVKGGRPGPPVVLADPDFGGRITSESGILAGMTVDRLPATAREASAIRRILPDALVMTGVAATETALKEVRQPALLHVATHGFFFHPDDVAAEPSGGERKLVYRPDTDDVRLTRLRGPLVQSGLVLAGVNRRDPAAAEDGVFTALEAAGLDLFGTKLVVLSACDSGVGEIKTGDGVYGLRRALVLAGSESQMMSLWPVSDRGTKELMEKFYPRLMTGEGRSDALRAVQLDLLRGATRAHPYFWAGFIQSGDWGPIVDARSAAAR